MVLEISIFENEKWNFYLDKSGIWENSLMIIFSLYPNKVVETHFRKFPWAKKKIIYFRWNFEKIIFQKRLAESKKSINRKDDT